jgi:hypothetical protein
MKIQQGDTKFGGVAHAHAHAREFVSFGLKKTRSQPLYILLFTALYLSNILK